MTTSMLERLMYEMGEAGRRLAEMGASEGAAGNISLYYAEAFDPSPELTQAEDLELPVAAPALAGGCLLVTGSGRRLRDIGGDPPAHLGLLHIVADGRSGRLYSAPRRRFARLTSELNSHLAVHEALVSAAALPFHAIVHAQPLHLTYLSHIPRYQESLFLSRRLLRWQPELILNLPEGLAALPFMLPGSTALMEATVTALSERRIVLWSRHGVMARSSESVGRAVDEIDYTETAAHYEYLNLLAGEPSDGLAPDEISAIAAAFGVQQSIL